MNDGHEMLAADRHRLLKEHLMSEIGRESEAQQASRPRRRLGWLAVPPLVVGLAVVAAVVAPGGRPAARVTPGGLTGSPAPVVSAPHPGPPSALPSTPPRPSLPPCTGASASPSTSAPAVTADGVKALAAAAQAAAAKPAPEVKSGQYVYTESLQQFGTDRPCVRQEWIAADGNSTGLIIDPHNGEMGFTPNAAGLPASLAVPNYRYLATLPTDPQKLLRRVYAEGNTKGNEPDGAAFRTIENVLTSQLVPPAVGGAFCQAAAGIPGAEVVPDAVDLLGRHGIGVIRSDSISRMELIFDPGTCEFLGHRDVQIADYSGQGGSPAGSVFTSAVVRQAVTDHLREQPPG